MSWQREWRSCWFVYWGGVRNDARISAVATLIPMTLSSKYFYGSTCGIYPGLSYTLSLLTCIFFSTLYLLPFFMYVFEISLCEFLTSVNFVPWSSFLASRNMSLKVDYLIFQTALVFINDFLALFLISNFVATFSKLVIWFFRQLEAWAFCL